MMHEQHFSQLLVTISSLYARDKLDLYWCYTELTDTRHCPAKQVALYTTSSCSRLAGDLLMLAGRHAPGRLARPPQAELRGDQHGVAGPLLQQPAPVVLHQPPCCQT